MEIFSGEKIFLQQALIFTNAYNAWLYALYVWMEHNNFDYFVKICHNKSPCPLFHLQKVSPLCFFYLQKYGCFKTCVYFGTPGTMHWTTPPTRFLGFDQITMSLFSSNNNQRELSIVTIMFSHISPSSMQRMDPIMVELHILGGKELAQVVIYLLVVRIVLPLEEVLH